MKVNLIKDTSVSKEVFTEVFDLLTSVPGPIQFSIDYNSLVEFNENEYFESVKLLEDYKKNFCKITLPISMKCSICGYGMIKISKNEIRCPKCDTELRDDMEKLYYEKLDKLSEDEKLQTFWFKLISNRRTVAFETLFEKCNNYRNTNDLEKEDFVILLTSMNNFYDWLSSFDEKSSYNGFIQTNDPTWLGIWKSKVSMAFPIAFELISIIIKKYIYNDVQDFLDKCHRKPIGCVNDLCFKKEDILLKYRTADICHYCMENLKQNLPITTILHALEILEFLRKKMLKSNDFMQLSPTTLSRMIIDKNRKIFLPDFENIHIDLDPLHTTLYMLYLFHPEGIKINSLCDHKTEMYHIYSHLSSRGDLHEMKSKIDRIANITSNSASEHIANIKTIFIDAIGIELAKNYYIHGPRSKVRKIDIDRKLVEISD